MSALASIDVTIEKRGSESITAVEILELLTKQGWNINNNGNTLYLPLGDDDDFDWQEAVINKEELFSIIVQKEEQQEIIGIGLTWENTDIGGTLLIHSNNLLSFSLTINRKVLSNNITDVNWYLERILPCFETNLITVERFAFAQD